MKIEPHVAIYMPIARGCMSDFDEKGVKMAVRKVGGNSKATGLFLPDVPSCRATKVDSHTGVNRNSVMTIPRSVISGAVLRQLDKCKVDFIKLYTVSVQSPD